MSTRLLLISNHLSRFPPCPDSDPLSSWRASSLFLNKPLIFRSFYGKNSNYISEIKSFLESSPLYNYYDDLALSREELREKVLKQIVSVSKAFPLSQEKEKKDPTLKLDNLMGLGEYDLAVSTRSVVTISLYLDSIANFGTEKHQKFVSRAYTLEDIGCFGMTELGHGSNVSALETTATYLKETREFLINSPSLTAAKWWIGAAAKTANMAIILAQLIIENKNQGVHMFLVQIRGAGNSEIPGVSLGDCGPKMSLEGVDNGFIIFNNYRVPYDSMLDKLSQISLSGKFSSTIKNKEKRLGIMIGALTRGRFCVILSSAVNLRNSVTIALRFSAVRKQFSPDGKSEVPILTYQNQKTRLIPILANCLAIKFSVNHMQDIYDKFSNVFLENPEGEELAEFHAVLSGLKAVCSWYGVTGTQICRESCGGLGYSSYSGLGRIRDNQEVNLTWEGDNSVLIQQTSKYILKQVQKTMKGQQMYSKHLRFLKIGIDESKKSGLVEKQDLHLAIEQIVNLYLNESMMKLQELSGSGETVNEVWNNCQTFYLQELAKSFTELMMARFFAETCQWICGSDQKTGEVFEKLHRLFCLTVLEKKLDVLFELGYELTVKKKIKEEILKLCGELSEVCIGVTDAIALSDKLLSSAIGVENGEIYKKITQLVESNPDCYKPPYWLAVLLEARKSNN